MIPEINEPLSQLVELFSDQPQLEFRATRPDAQVSRVASPVKSSFPPKTKGFARAGGYWFRRRLPVSVSIVL